MQKHILFKEWCSDCFAECYFDKDEDTGRTEHLGAGSKALAPRIIALKAQGFIISHRGYGDFIATRYADRLLPTAQELMYEDLANQFDTTDDPFIE